MFIHNFKYSLRILFKDRMLIFWTFAFPIILGTFFHMAFSDIEKNEKLDVINIAIVEDDTHKVNNIYKASFASLSDKNSKNRLFDVEYTSLKKAEQLLEDSKISGYLVFLEDVAKIFVSTNGINETIFKFVVDEIAQTETIMHNIFDTKINEYALSLEPHELEKLNSLYDDIYKEVLKMRENSTDSIQDVSSNNLSYTMIEFYTLIAMSCLYGGILSMIAINKNLPNMGSNGKRIAISPTQKFKLIFSSLLASFITQLIGVLLLFLYTIFILHVDYGSHIFYVILQAIVGSFAGLSLGLFVACVFKVSEGTKTGIVLSITMLGCFFSGMMGITMKYIIDKNLPIINIINPVNMITDGLYSLYYYDTMDRFYLNFVHLLLFSFIMIGFALVELRRQKYDSI